MQCDTCSVIEAETIDFNLQEGKGQAVPLLN
jgi:hypothetical protein